MNGAATHDIIIAIIGGFALVLAAALPFLVRQYQKVRDNRVDLISLREGMAAAHHQREMEHRELRDLIEKRCGPSVQRQQEEALAEAVRRLMNEGKG